jgi:hypothetical protein
MSSVQPVARSFAATILSVVLLGCSLPFPNASSSAAPSAALPTAPPEPSPTTSPKASGSCQGLVPDLCAAALAEAEANGLFLASGQVVVFWVARPTAFKTCDGIIMPKVDVVFTTRNPTVVRTVTVGVLPDSRLAACTY